MLWYKICGQYLAEPPRRRTLVRQQLCSWQLACMYRCKNSAPLNCSHAHQTNGKLAVLSIAQTHVHSYEVVIWELQSCPFMRDACRGRCS